VRLPRLVNKQAKAERSKSASHPIISIIGDTSLPRIFGYENVVCKPISARVPRVLEWSVEKGQEVNNVTYACTGPGLIGP
jgi:hypothetical protein